MTKPGRARLASIARPEFYWVFEKFLHRLERLYQACSGQFTPGEFDQRYFMLDHVQADSLLPSFTPSPSGEVVDQL